MSFEQFEVKANQITEQHKKALEQGRKVGTLQDHGIFLRPDAPAHLRNAPITLESPAEWEARVEANQTQHSSSESTPSTKPERKVSRGD